MFKKLFILAMVFGIALLAPAVGEATISDSVSIDEIVIEECGEQEVEVSGEATYKASDRALIVKVDGDTKVFSLEEPATFDFTETYGVGEHSVSAKVWDTFFGVPITLKASDSTTFEILSCEEEEEEEEEPTEQEICEEGGGTWNAELEECENDSEDDNNSGGNGDESDEEEEEDTIPPPSPQPAPQPSPSPSGGGSNTSGRILEKCQWPQYFQLPQCEDGVWEEPVTDYGSFWQQLEDMKQQLLEMLELLKTFDVKG